MNMSIILGAISEYPGISGESLTFIVVGFGVVMLVLTALSLLTSLIGTIFQKYGFAEAPAAKVPVASAPVAASPSDGITQETVAIISAAVSATSGVACQVSSVKKSD